LLRAHESKGDRNMITQLEEAAPYGAAADDYLVTGLGVPLPIPPGSKKIKETGVTGRYTDATLEQIAHWVGDKADHNIAIRLAEKVVGIDVDDYGDKIGGFTLADLVGKLGPLPDTAISSSREGVSGIRFFRVPAGLRWPSKAGKDIEVISHGYRYAVVWPSIHPDTGEMYRWRGSPPGGIPRVDELPELPTAWIMHLTGGEVEADLSYDEAAADEILTAGEPCRLMRTRLDGYRRRVDDGAGHHPAMRDASLAIVGAGRDGHEGAAAALNELFDRFTADVDRPDAVRDYRRAVDGAIKIVLAEPFEGRRSCCRLSTLAKLEHDPDEDFWAARESLATIRQYAKAQLVPPWGVLGGALARVVAATPSSVRLPAIVGPEASLNLFLGFVGPSGAGKGASNAVAEMAVEIPEELQAETFSPGSGEGLIGIYAVKVKEDKVWTTVRLRHRAIVDVPEVDALAALGAGRSGSTLMPFLRQAWSGEALGRSNATPERNVSIPKHSYRLVMLVGIQPERAEVLISDTQGTAQRFLWLPMVDRDPIDIEAPAPFKWKCPRWPVEDTKQTITETHATAYGGGVMEFCRQAWDDVREDRKQRLRQTGPVLDGQAMLGRMKIAAALAILEGRYDVDEEDWRLAAFIMAKSDETRSGIESELRERASQSHKARGKLVAQQEIAAADVKAEHRIQQASETILHRLDPGEWLRKSDVRGALRSDYREHFDDAINALILTGKVEKRPTANGRGEELRKVA
jgi:hypothetical protein